MGDLTLAAAEGVFPRRLQLPVFPDLLLPRRAAESEWFIRTARRRRMCFAFFDRALRRGGLIISST
jgi:hypothetical protein